MFYALIFTLYLTSGSTSVMVNTRYFETEQTCETRASALIHEFNHNSMVVGSEYKCVVAHKEVAEE